MLLRAATADDVPSLVALAREGFTSAFGHQYAPEDLASFLDTARAPSVVAASIADPDTGVMLACEGDDLVGYCTVHFRKGLDERPEPRPSRPATLSQLYCAPSATGRGIGQALMTWALGEARARGCDAVQLTVWSGNHGAQRFYRRYGFTKVADIDFWVGRHRDDELLYELSLGPAEDA